MKDFPLVTVVTGYYNRKENLKESVQSVLNQDYPNFEYIIFDDCSTDGTYEMLREFSDPRLRVLRHEQNIGFTKGIIAAIAYSKGELIAIHGAGDLSFSARLRKQVEFLDTHPDIGIVGCLLEDVSSEGTVIHSPLGDNSKHHFTQGEVMYRKSLYFHAGGYNSFFKYGQFTILKHELLKLTKAGFVEEVLYRRIHFQNGVTRNPRRLVEQRCYIALGKEIAEGKGFLYHDSSEVIARVCISNIEHVIGTPQEELLLFHLRRRSYSLTVLFRICKSGLLSVKFFKKMAFRYLSLLDRVRF